MASPEGLPPPAELQRRKELNLYNKEWVTDSHLANLAEQLATNISLTFLGFRECRNIGDAGVVALAPALAQNLTVKKLILESTAVGDSGASALAMALPTSGLIRLDLGYCKVGNSGARALAKAIARDPPLTNLVLDHCVGVSDEGAGFFLEALKSNMNLQVLSVRGTSISSALRVPLDALLQSRVREQMARIGRSASMPGSLGHDARQRAQRSKMDELRMNRRRQANEDRERMVHALLPFAPSSKTRSQAQNLALRQQVTDNKKTLKQLHVP